jgi:hypothetical protein
LNAAIASDCAADDDAAEEDECLVHPSSRQLAWVAEADRGDVASARATAPEERRAAAAMSADISREVVHERRGIYRVRKRPTRALACVGHPARRLFILLLVLQTRLWTAQRVWFFSAQFDERAGGRVSSLGAHRAAEERARRVPAQLRGRHRGCAAG